MFIRTEKSIQLRLHGETFLFKRGKPDGTMELSHCLLGKRCAQVALVQCKPSMLLPNGVPSKSLIRVHLEQLSVVDVKLKGRSLYFFSPLNYFSGCCTHFRKRGRGERRRRKAKDLGRQGIACSIAQESQADLPIIDPEVIEDDDEDVLDSILEEGGDPAVDYDTAESIL